MHSTTRSSLWDDDTMGGISDHQHNTVAPTAPPSKRGKARTLTIPRVKQKYRKFYFALFVLIMFSVLAAALLQFWPVQGDRDIPDNIQYTVRNIPHLPNVVVEEDAELAGETNPSCRYQTCFDVYRCPPHADANQISVGISPIRRYLDSNGVIINSPPTREYDEILEAIVESEYFTPDSASACLVVPPIDLLNQNLLRLKETGQVLAQLPRWNSGMNHLLFNMLPGTLPDFNTTIDVATGDAIIAGGGFSSVTYRPEFDVSIPVFNPLLEGATPALKSHDCERPLLLVSGQTNIHREYREQLDDLASDDAAILVLDHCHHDNVNFSRRCSRDHSYQYPDVLKEATFCAVIRGSRLGQTSLHEALLAGCIPVVISDFYVMPFNEVLDWTQASVKVREEQISQLPGILRSISPGRVCDMQAHVKYFYQQYFSSMKAITLTTLKIINDRVFPYSARSLDAWNEPKQLMPMRSPLFLPFITPASKGFTAVVLTYDRIESLFAVLRSIVDTPSLVKIIVVWNNQDKFPPPRDSWPTLSKPLKVIQTSENKLSNRFYPYSEIETECILAIDDDIVMLTTDELQFGYEVWREFPDRIVGYPGRLHVWDETNHMWKYESEWTNDISMVLTGAAFYHKYFSHVYTYLMPTEIKEWVDGHMNCEDIAMNFVVANATAKAPIKVAARKKFKCPHCTNVELLSSDEAHMMERSQCITEFTRVYGYMPLVRAPFRADPVLYKENVLDDLKKFKDVGSL